MKGRFLKKAAAAALALALFSGGLPVQPVADFFGSAAITASAAPGDVVASGNCGKTAEDNVTWELTKNADDETKYTLTISGTGAMSDLAFDSRPWETYYRNITSVVIGSGITSIGTYAFYLCTSLATVTIADGSQLTTIGDKAFSSTAITSITIPAGVTSIGDMAFNHCSSLATVTIADGSQLTTIGDNAFGYTAITSITIPAGVTSIGSLAFNRCSSLATVTIADGSQLTTIENNAFHYTAITSITLPASVTFIGQDAFSYCSNLATINYLGTSAQWNAVETGFQWKDYDCKVNCLIKTVTIDGNITNGTVTADKTTAAQNETVTLTVTPASGYAVKSVTYNDGEDHLIEPVNGVYSFTMPDEDVTVTAEFVEPVTYLDENGVEQTVTDYTVLTGTEITLDAGWYVVNSNISYDHKLNINGDVSLILSDGYTMTVEPTGYGACIYDSSRSHSLDVYGQSNGTGKLSITASGEDWGNTGCCILMGNSYTQHSGTVEVTTSGKAAVGISASYVSINGGTVNTNIGASYSKGINGKESLVISGGKITAIATGEESDGIGCDGGGTIELGLTNPNDFITASSYFIPEKNETINTEAGTLKIADGQILTDGTNIYYGTLTDEQVKALAGKTLTVADSKQVTYVDINENSTTRLLYFQPTGSGGYVADTPYLDGYTYTGMSVNGKFCENMTAVVTEAKALLADDPNADIKIAVVYEQKNTEYALTIENGHLRNSTNTSGSFKASTQLYAVADDAPDGQIFSHWEVDGKTVSYETTYAFRMPSKAMKLTAKYVANNVEVTKAGTGYIENVYKPEDGKMAFVSILSVPEGCQMLKAGIVAQKVGDFTGDLTKDNAKFVRFSDTSKNSYTSFKYTWTLTPKNADDEWTVRPYLAYTDAQGEHTVYGDAVSYSLNTIA